MLSVEEKVLNKNNTDWISGCGSLGDVAMETEQTNKLVSLKIIFKII